MNDIEIKVKFLRDLGIRRDNYPETFLDPIQDITKIITNVEMGYCGSSSRCDGQPGMFCIKDVMGTDHSRYAGKTWIEAFLDLDRGFDIIKLYETNPYYWEEIKNVDNSDIGLIKYEDKYYIFSKAGGGNNRLIAMKIKYLALIHQAGNNKDEIERINNQFTFSANIRELPKDNRIPFIVVAIDEDLRGLSVTKKGNLFTVTKKFTDKVLFKGNDDQLIEYFKSLFNTNIYDENEVKDRLESLEIGCRLSSEKYRKALEDIIHQFTSSNQFKKR